MRGTARGAGGQQDQSMPPSGAERQRSPHGVVVVQRGRGGLEHPRNPRRVEHAPALAIHHHNNPVGARPIVCQKPGLHRVLQARIERGAGGREVLLWTGMGFPPGQGGTGEVEGCRGAGLSWLAC